MLTYIMIAVILGLAVWGAVSTWRSEGSFGWTIFVFISSAVICSIPGFGLLYLVGSAIPGGERVSVTQELAALGNDSTISGSFFLGSGIIDEEQVFQYIAETENGGFYLTSIPAWKVVIYEDATEDSARFVNYIRVRDEWWFSPLPVQLIDGYRDEFHVPPGSVNQQYRISVTD